VSINSSENIFNDIQTHKKPKQKGILFSWKSVLAG